MVNVRKICINQIINEKLEGNTAQQNEADDGPKTKKHNENKRRKRNFIL